MLFVSFVVLLILFLPILFPGHYITELLVSFLPYSTLIAWSFIVISFLYLKNRMKTDHRFPLSTYFRILSLLMSCFLFFSGSRQIDHFYGQKLPSQELSTGSLKILFANIHKDNVQYKEIEKIISDNDPDMLMFVEFAEHHYTHLKSFLQQRYPYVNSTTRSKKFIGNMVFSKLPLSNEAYNFPQWMWRYWYFSLEYQWQAIYFYLVHTSSPDNYSHFIMRNKQLTSLVQDFQTRKSFEKHDNVVVLWDFNTTPRSPYYSILTQWFSGQLTNITQHTPLIFTRSFKEFPLFFAHIDHLWASSWLNVQNFKVIPMPWSDHKSFLFTLHPEQK